MNLDWEDQGLGDIRRRFEQASVRLLDLVQAEMIGQLTAEAPVSSGDTPGGSGALRSSFFPQGRGLQPRDVFSEVDYWLAVATGTEPHTIEPFRRDFLAFEWPDAPRGVREMFADTFPTVFFKEIEHPGTEGDNYIARAVSNVRGRLGDLANRAFQEAGL